MRLDLERYSGSLQRHFVNISKLHLFWIPDIATPNHR